MPLPTWKPAQCVPSKQTNAQSSTAFAAVDAAGIDPPAHRTPVNVGTRLPVLSCTVCNENDLPAAAVGIVNVQEAVNVYMCIV
jgi:hypothetical protein